MSVTATQSSQRIAFEARLNLALAPHPKAFALKHGELIAKAKKRDGAAATLLAIVRLACKLSVDPRWLATGEVSAAAKAAQQRSRIWNVIGPGQTMIDERPFRGLLASLELTEQPAIGPGSCRYCFVAGSADWVDSAHTICSACLLGES